MHLKHIPFRAYIYRVSDYLNLCLLDEFKHIVHVSSISWFTLILIVNIIYYIMGMVYVRTTNDAVINNSLASIYLSYAVLCVVVSYIVSIKMKRIFFKIVKDETWIKEISTRADNGDIDRSARISSIRRHVSFNEQSEVGQVKQYGYFWGSDPKYVIIIAQLGQLG